MSVHKPRLVYGGEGKSGFKGCVLRRLSVSGRRVEIGKGLKKMEELTHL